MEQKFFELLEEENKKGATILFRPTSSVRFKDYVIVLPSLKRKIVTVEKISTLQENNYKKFKVETDAPLDKNYFQIDGVNKLDIHNNVTSFLFKGNINTVMKKIADIEITNLWIEEPDLEESFYIIMRGGLKH
ncbi:ABC transporter OS=Lysinibacillus sphaericus OX=1421 GN=LS41612_15120 PE=4 SV=1 [Lysinibacillus sphaericus]